MKYIVSIIFSLLLSAGTLSAQSLESGIEYYRDGEYQQAIEVLNQVEDPRARLFEGKSYFATGQYLRARRSLSAVVSDNSADLFAESLYTLALVEFQLRDFPSSLDHLHEISENYRSSSVRSSAVSLYTQILNFLTESQRFQIFSQSAYDEVRLDVLESSVGKVDYGTLKAMFGAYEQASSNAARYSNRLAEVSAMLDDPVFYRSRYSFQYPEAPQGISYDLGVVLPGFDENTPEYEITQNLYFGIQLAVDRFNSEASNRRVFIHYRDSESNPEMAGGIITDLIWNAGADGIIGPLFSEVAASFGVVAEEYQIPLLLPLANSDRLGDNQNFTFQFNPTFSVQGKQMARYAFNSLGYDTVSVIAESGALGEASAEAFYAEFSRLGGNVVRFDIRDLESEGYDIQDYTEYLNPENDSTFTVDVDAIYAPFTGAVASTLISSLATEIEAAGSDITILGSEEWNGIELSTLGLEDNLIYFTRGFNIRTDSADFEEFDSEFRLRFNVNPNRFAYIGYDVAMNFLNTIREVGNPEYLRRGLKNIQNYSGFAMEVNFGGEQLNQSVGIQRLP